MSHKSERKAAAAAAAALKNENQIENQPTTPETPPAEDSKTEEAATPENRHGADENEISKKVSKVVSSKIKTAFMEPFIAGGKFTQKELAEIMAAEFPQMTMVTINTFLTDSKNPKYNKFDKLVVVNSEKKMVFASDIQEAA